MPKTIATGDLFQGGRIDAYNPLTGQSFRRYAGILDPADGGLEFNFPNAQATGNIFGSVRSMFVDNSENNFEVRVTVAGTRQTFPVSANSTGFYVVDSQQGSTILVETAGVSTDAVEIIFYNYPQVPYVWFRDGSSVAAAVTIANGADAALGTTTDPAITNPATNGTLIAFIRGILTGVNALVLGTAVTEADGANVALGSTTDAAITNPATNGTLIGFTRGILTSTNAAAASLVSLLVDTAAMVVSLGNIDTDTSAIVANTNALSYNNITTSTTTVVKAAPGVLGKVTVNTAGGAGSIIVYDHASGVGTIIATLDSTVAGSFDFNAIATIGITVVTTGAPNVTILYR